MLVGWKGKCAYCSGTLTSQEAGMRLIDSINVSALSWRNGLYEEGVLWGRWKMVSIVLLLKDMDT